MKKELALLFCAVLVFNMGVTSCSTVEQEEKIILTLIMSETVAQGNYRPYDDYDLCLVESGLGVIVQRIKCNNSELNNCVWEAAENSDIVVITDFDLSEIGEIADAYKTTKFVLLGNAISNVDKYDNVLCIVFDRAESVFMAGYLSAALSSEGTVGIDSQNEKDIIDAYTKGARTRRPDIEVTAVCKTDIYLDALGNVIMNNEPICRIKTDKSKAIFDIVRSVAEDGIWRGGIVLTADISSGYISLIYEDDFVIEDELKAELAILEAKIISGEIKV